MGTSGANRQSPLGLFPAQPTPGRYDQLLEVLRTRHYSRRTEQTYAHWIICISQPPPPGGDGRARDQRLQATIIRLMQAIIMRPGTAANEKPGPMA